MQVSTFRSRCGYGLWFCWIVAAVLAASGHAAADGRDIYNFRCYFCHGYAGDARTLAAAMLIPPPRDFTRSDPAELDRERMLQAVRDGIPGTAMKPFASVLDGAELAAVVDFVRDEFMRRKAPNTHYHTAANGWPDHERFAAAFPFARGELPIDAAAQGLTPAQRAGRSLYLRSCISCHDLGRATGQAPYWEPEAVSYPRAGFKTGDFLEPVDAVSGATPYARHDRAPIFSDLDPAQRRGEVLFQQNCAFCHAADGTGKNWIGTFMIPHPRDLTSREAMHAMTAERLREVIRTGLPGTSMPAWGGVLAPDEIEAIVRYIDRAFHPVTGVDSVTPAARRE